MAKRSSTRKLKVIRFFVVIIVIVITFVMFNYFNNNFMQTINTKSSISTSSMPEVIVYLDATTSTTAITTVPLVSDSSLSSNSTATSNKQSKTSQTSKQDTTDNNNLAILAIEIVSQTDTISCTSAQFTFSATPAANTSGTATYEWIRWDDKPSGQSGTISFDASGQPLNAISNYSFTKYLKTDAPVSGSVALKIIVNGISYVSPQSTFTFNELTVNDGKISTICNPT